MTSPGEKDRMLAAWANSGVSGRILALCSDNPTLYKHIQIILVYAVFAAQLDPTKLPRKDKLTHSLRRKAQLVGCFTDGQQIHARFLTIAGFP
jgi:hypothetical protein